MKTVKMNAEQTALYDAGDSPAWRAERQHLMGIMDAIGEQYWREGVHVECVTADGIVVWAHDYEGGDTSGTDDEDEAQTEGVAS